MPTFSVIVPVHNAEKTLRKCLDSICNQTHSDFEVLMVENGSKDASNDICKEYASKDSRFILHTCKDSCGPSGARNIGLEKASGEFVAFVDSDDFVDADYLVTLQQSFAATDVVFFGYHQIRTDGTSMGIHLPDISADMGYYEMLVHLQKQDMFGYTWIKAFRRSVVGEHRFSMELNLFEDEVFACQVLTEPRRITVIPKSIYNYVTGNAGSLVSRTHADYCHKVDIAYGAWKQLLQSYDKKDEVLAAMANAHVNRCMYYGFERDVNVKEFYCLLADSEFFGDKSASNNFCDCVEAKNFKMLSQMRIVYRLKVSIAKLLKR